MKEGLIRENEIDSLYLYNHLPKGQINTVIGSTFCEICPEFMGFVTQYKKLSELIPKEFTIIDLGCASAAQCYYFKDHEKYIGIDVLSSEDKQRFKMENSQHLKMTINDFLNTETYKSLDLQKTFAIMNYVPSWYELKRDSADVRKAFLNLFVFYPTESKEKLFNILRSIMYDQNRI